MSGHPLEAFVVRKATIEDVAAVAAIEADVFVDPWGFHLYVQEIDQPLRFQRVATTADGRVVAYLFAVWQYDELHVLKVATHPLFAGRGLATTLLAAARDEAEHGRGRGLVLEVRPSNVRAISLYRTVGYRVVGRRPGYYTNGEDALVMQFDLQAAHAGPA